MTIGLLNWADAENDPFTAFNAALKLEFEACGRDVVVIPLGATFRTALETAMARGLDYVLAWQGVGSAFARKTGGPCIWDELELPLFCIHGDHPCHMPPNHAAQSTHVRHWYGAASFARYANRHFPRTHRAETIDPVVVYRKARFLPPEGDWFVFPKNLDDVELTLQQWRERFPRPLYTLLADCVEAIRAALRTGRPTDHHEVIDHVLAERDIGALVARIPGVDATSMAHSLHDELDKTYRNVLSEHVLDELADVPLRVYGRGWERHAARGNPRHQFHPAGKAADNEHLYYSGWGIVDVAPAFDSVHDRTLRAIACRTSFLAACSWPWPAGVRRLSEGLLFNGALGNLRQLAEEVIADPQRHHARCVAFGRSHQEWRSHGDWLRTFDEALATVEA
ncbi:hypothetical protein [Ramlibacter albus]|uniref:Uncharacterized protein n=1 Tax=Ramlibacter albus TaxID=2079448 RepID=A0A923M5S3_9BURK|nr:hypothetical protein [Ramlibacter albus]MBC5764326.1 hypothetical protein [Ramlibacter albus]